MRTTRAAGVAAHVVAAGLASPGAAPTLRGSPNDEPDTMIVTTAFPTPLVAGRAIVSIIIIDTLS